MGKMAVKGSISYICKKIRMKKFPLCVAFYAFFSLCSFSQKRISPEDYIEKYKDLAVSEMKRSGIPASITLAQGMHESDFGNSTLAVEGNNHFGVKCHKWTGATMYKDDDRRNECFRKYKSAKDSYIDHTNFILSGQRYNFLFEYKTTDYKSWAKGLKKAGYATNPRYPEIIIKTIEDYQLYTLDKGGDIIRSTKSNRSGGERKESSSDFSINLDKHPVHRRNDVEYVVVQQGDTYEKLARELDMFKWEFLRYNELTEDSELHEGQILYLQPKKRKAEYGNELHNVLPGETLYSISQLYAIKMKHLRRINRLKTTDEVQPGDILSVRRKVPRK
jgi:LysM repeat protein